MYKMKIITAGFYICTMVASVVVGVSKAKEQYERVEQHNTTTQIEFVKRDTIFNHDQKSLDHDFVMSIESYIDSVLIPRFEGGYVADDVGHPANFGINGGSYPKLNIKTLTQEQAKVIYIRDYWKRNNLHKIESNRMALLMFDFAVNAGYQANRQLQHLLNDWGYNIKVDGGIGDETIGIINSYMQRHGEERLLKEYSWKRRVYYMNLKNYSKYGKSWLNRVSTLNSILDIG